MKKTDNIEKLFKETFEHFEADVNPNVWANVQGGINSGIGSAAGTAAKFTIGKIIAGAAAVTVIAGSAWYFSQSKNGFPSLWDKINTSDNNQNKTEIVSIETAQNIISEKKSEKKNGDSPTNNQTSSPIPSASSTAISTTQAQNTSDVTSNETNSLSDNANNSNSSSQPAHKYGNASQGNGGILRYNKAVDENTTASKDNSSPEDNSSNNESASEAGSATDVDPSKEEETKTISEISFVPNVFSPNGDGNNDIFFFKMKNIASIGVAILNQRGEMVAKWNSLEGSWNGKTFSGSNAPEGVYLYFIQGKGIDGAEHSKKGSITLKR